MNVMDAGYYHYYCMTKAIEIQFNVKRGILLMSDDVLFKNWHMKQLNHDKIRFPEIILICLDHESMKNWVWWSGSIGNVKKLFQFVDEVVENKTISRNQIDFEVNSSSHGQEKILWIDDPEDLDRG